jgi:HlyD family secretion protein
MKRVYYYIIAGFIGVGSAGYYFLGGNSGSETQYRTEKVTRGDIVVQVRATGTINPVRTVQVGSQVSGIIAKIFVDFNSVVKEGQIIALIDSTFLSASVKEAEANLERTQAQVDETRRNYARTEELFRKDLVSQAELDAAQTAHEQALAQLKQTRAALDRARVNLKYSVIRAPIDGVVISRVVDVGQTVAASLQAPQLFVIANDLKEMQVEASVDEADIGQIREGQRVTFTVDAYPNEQFRGTVSQVRLAPVTVQNVVTYTVIIEVPNPDLKLRPGMTATVSILVDRRSDVLRVPTMALRFQPSDDIRKKFETGQTENRSEEKARPGRRGVEESGTSPRRWQMAMSDRRPRDEGSTRRSTAQLWVLEGKRDLRPVTVTLGLNDNRYVEVEGEGLKEDDDIVIGALNPEGGAASGQQTNPFGPRMPGGGSGGRSRF